MSTAARVPETWHLTGDDARRTLIETGHYRLVKDAFLRLRAADGFSHARSLAFTMSLVLVQGVIAVVGLSFALGGLRPGEVIVDTIEGALPGVTSGVLTDAVEQAERVGGSDRYIALLVGLVGTLVTGATAIGQVERGFNRLYGIERDRPTVQKYGRAALLAASAGAALASAFVLLTLGGAAIDDSSLDTAWTILRWPLALVALTAGLTALLRLAPRRRQPDWSWLAYGAAICVAGWTLVTLLLAAVLGLSSSFGDTYGPLAGLVALQLWTLLSAVAILYGAAVAAQLEAVRADVCLPRSNRADARRDALAAVWINR